MKANTYSTNGKGVNLGDLIHKKMGRGEGRFNRHYDTGLTSGTSSRMKGPSLPVLNRVSNFLDTINRASEAL